MLIRPLAKTMALGGVDIGNIKAQLAAIVTGIHSCMGAMPAPTAMAPTTGRNIVTKATFDITSVRNKETVVSPKIKTHPAVSTICQL